VKEGRLGEEGRVVGVGRDGRGGEGGVGEVGEEVLFVLQLSGGVKMAGADIRRRRWSGLVHHR